MTTTEQCNHPLLDQLVAYHDMKEALERDFFGKWVVIYGGELTANFDSYDEAERFVWGGEGDLDVAACLVRQVGIPAAILLSHD